jgi:hypothetical protein
MLGLLGFLGLEMFLGKVKVFRDTTIILPILVGESFARDDKV